MVPTDRFNAEICAALSALGIAHGVSHGIITIDRTSMVRASPYHSEDEAYGCVLALLEELCPAAAWIGWSGRTDDYLGIEVYAHCASGEDMRER